MDICSGMNDFEMVVWNLLMLCVMSVDIDLVGVVGVLFMK